LLLELGFDFLSSHLLRNIRYSDPEHTDRHCTVTSLVIYGKLNLVGLVDVELVELIRPPVVSCSTSASLGGIFDLHDNKSFRSSAESSSSSMVDIGHSMNLDGKTASKRFAGTGDIETIIYAQNISQNIQGTISKI